MKTESKLISKKKPIFPLSDSLRAYLGRYNRIKDRGVRFEDLGRYDNAVPLYDEQNKDTLWSTLFYPGLEFQGISDDLLTTYAVLKSDGDMSAVADLYVDRVDLCLYGNTLPYRVRIVNSLNENFDYFYVKRVDANRVYGLELEHILSPSRINYFIHGDTMIEEHVIGLPAEDFIDIAMPTSRFDLVRLGKEFVKFNERCFVRLLGDMHAGNFVVEIRRDFERSHFMFRAMDFDQQSHHWRMKAYMPQFWIQNNPYVNVSLKYLTRENRVQYQKEERALIANRVRVSHGRFDALIEAMRGDVISSQENVKKLGAQLAKHYGEPAFARGGSMGDLVHASTQLLLVSESAAQPSTG
ncbi:MAG: hypothetical protein BMS9Abin05_2345 [Rhodothermia bacterium]|nr:MAG: hypothetical protein BMS9Abin05_2345 [Rhodothermia bacterium]